MAEVRIESENIKELKNELKESMEITIENLKLIKAQIEGLKKLNEIDEELENKIKEFFGTLGKPETVKPGIEEEKEVVDTLTSGSSSDKSWEWYHWAFLALGVAVVSYAGYRYFNYEEADDTVVVEY